jgi:hypothetical protein
MTKKELIEYYKNMIYKVGLCSSVKINHFEIYLELMDLFTNHPEYPDKIGNVIDVAIVKNKINSKYLELQIIKDDKTIDNISYRCCINKPTKDKNLKSAMRYAIYPQILEFKNGCDIIECYLCKSKEDIHIDHIILFKSLYDDFIKDRKDIPSTFDDNFYNTAIFKKEDEVFKNEWIEYHKNNASLRCLCKTCNLTRGKK